MNIGKNPAFLFYPSDFQHSVRRWSKTEVGEYILMLCEQADSETGSIEPDIFDAEVESDRVRKKFDKDKSGYYNPRLRGVLIKRASFIQKQTDRRKNRGSTVEEPNKGNGNGNGKGNGNRTGKGKKSSSITEPIRYPFTDEDFIRWWNLWKEYKREQHRFTYKGRTSEQAALKKLANLSGGDSNVACMIIEQSIGNGWKGFFELKPESDARRHNFDKAVRTRTDEIFKKYGIE